MEMGRSCFCPNPVTKLERQERMDISGIAGVSADFIPIVRVSWGADNRYYLRQ